AESGFDPLSRTCRFMLTEEAHHMFVGEAGIMRIVQRACELMREHKTDDLRKHGGIDLRTMQRYLNFHCSVSLDLFGSEISTNAANFYTAGLKGRFEETKKQDDHLLKEATDGRVISQAEWDAKHSEWLPTEEDKAYIESLMVPVTEPGKFANWISPPARGINGQPVEFEYVRLA